MSVRSLLPLILMVSVLNLGCPGTNRREPIVKGTRTSTVDEKSGLGKVMDKEKGECLSLPAIVGFMVENKTAVARITTTSFYLRPFSDDTSRVAALDPIVAARLLNTRDDLALIARSDIQLGDIQGLRKVHTLFDLFDSPNQNGCVSLVAANNIAFRIIKPSRKAPEITLISNLGIQYKVAVRNGRIVVEETRNLGTVDDGCNKAALTSVTAIEIAFRSGLKADPVIDFDLIKLIKNYTSVGSDFADYNPDARGKNDKLKRDRNKSSGNVAVNWLVLHDAYSRAIKGKFINYQCGRVTPTTTDQAIIGKVK